MTITTHKETKISLSTEEIRLAVLAYVDTRMKDNQESSLALKTDQIVFIGNNNELVAEITIQDGGTVGV